MDGRAATLAWAAGMLALALACRARGRPLLWRTARTAPTDVSLGVPREGAHAARVAGAAAVDLAASAGFAALLAGISGGSTVAWLVAVLVSGEALHAGYGVPTPTQRWLFDAQRVP